MRTRMVITIVGALLAWLALANHAMAVIRYVKPGGTGDGLGGWGNATSDLYDAMYDSDENDQVWVAGGTYLPGTSQSAYFPLKAGVVVKGGYYADEQHPDARDENPLTNGTVLSGDIGNPGIANDNCYCVVMSTGTSLYPTVLDGFTITSGYGGWYNNGFGAGLCITGGASPTLANLRITDCFAPWYGGGVFVEDGSPTFTNCRFESNRSDYGGALYLHSSSAQLPVTMDRCVFVSNSAANQAAAIFNSGGEPLRIWNTIFTANRCLGADEGSVVANYGSNAQFANCLIHANAGLSAAVVNGGYSDITLINNTITYNTSACGTCAGFYNQGTATVNNTLFWGNAAQDVQDETAQIAYTTLPLVRYCAIQGLVDQGGLDSGNNDQNLGDAAGFDPAFVNAAAGNLRLLPDSPCLDNGDNTVQGLPSDDLDGGDRIVSNVVDRGVYEYHFVDCNGNNTPDAEDIANCDPDHPAWYDGNGNNVPHGATRRADPLRKHRPARHGAPGFADGTSAWATATATVLDVGLKDWR